MVYWVLNFILKKISCFLFQIINQIGGYMIKKALVFIMDGLGDRPIKEFDNKNDIGIISPYNNLIIKHHLNTHTLLILTN